MAYISYNIVIPRRYFGDSLQMTNCILNSGATLHIRPYILDLILVSLLETDKYIEFEDGDFITVNKIGKVQIKSAMIMENLSLLCYITYYLLHNCVMDYFTLLC